MHPLLNNLRLEILASGYHPSRNGEWNYPDTNVPFNRLYLNMGGDAYVVLGSRRTDLRAGVAYLLPRNRTITLGCRDRVAICFFHFHFSLFRGGDLFDAVDTVRAQSCPAARIRRDFIRPLRRRHLADLVRLQGRLLELLSGFIDGDLREMRRLELLRSRYQPLFDALEKAKYADLTVAGISGQLGLTPSGLYKSFRRDTGTGLKQFIGRERMRLAKELLLCGGERVKEIATQLGFRDEYYFSRFFHRQVGCSPSAYRHSQGCDRFQ
ncbi:MAG: helix-turn-helix transcriptional regulator [Kiritimatiellae bacterium]|nr:helix-turn-helix transcriptional regulator [Kiritimatiellia bacterium]